MDPFCPSLVIPLTDEEMGTTVRELNHDGRIHFAGGGERCIHGTGADAIHGREGELVRFGMIEKFFHLFSKEDAGPELFAHRMIVEGFILGWMGIFRFSTEDDRKEAEIIPITRLQAIQP